MRLVLSYLPIKILWLDLFYIGMSNNFRKTWMEIFKDFANWYFRLMKFVTSR